MLAVVAGMGEERGAVETRCDKLARQRQFIQDCGIHELPNGDSTPRYGFIHALYQNVLYERVPAARRVQLHRRIGEKGEALFGDRVGEIAAELAMHFERGSNHKQAVKYLQQSAENAIRRFAYQEAVELARRGLELLERLPDTPERVRQELGLQIALGVPLIATEGYAASGVGTAYTRALELCRKLNEPPEIAQVLWGLWAFYLLKAELGRTREIAEEFLRLAERMPDPGLAMRGHFALEITFLHLGRFPQSIEHFRKALSLYDPEEQNDDDFLYAQNPGVATRCHAAWALWFLGQPDQALDIVLEALSMARLLSEPHGLAHALFFAATIHQLRREARQAQEHAEEAIAVSGEHRLALYHAMTTITRGWALVHQGLRQDEAIDQIREGLAAYQATGSEVLRPHFMALLAEALGTYGQVEEGLPVLEEALAMSHSNGEAYYKAELYRIKGESLLSKGTGRGISRAVTRGKKVLEAETSVVAQAEACLKRAVYIAGEQKAKSWELRAVMSLARLYHEQHRKEEARRLLTAVYDGFSEGFDTMDLREAKLLLDVLS